MSIPPPEPAGDPDRLARARQRRASRMLTQLRADEREAFLEDLARVVTPGADMFVLVVAAGLMIGFGFRLDQRALLLAGVLLAPRMAPLAGLSLSAVSGSPRFFARQLAGLAVAVALLLASSALSGGLGVPAGRGTILAAGHTRLNLVDFGLLLGGAVVVAYSLARHTQISPLGSVAMAYETLLPLAVVGIGLVRSDPHLWQGALLTAALHLTWAVLAGMATLVALGFRPLVGGGRSLPAAISLVGLIGLLSAAGLGASVLASAPTPTPTPTVTPTPTPTSTGTATPTPSPTNTGTPTATPTATLTPTPAPRAVVYGGGDAGVFLRQAPGGTPVAGLFHGMSLEVLGGPQRFGDQLWWQVRTTDGQVGWILAAYLATVTPTPTPAR